MNRIIYQSVRLPCSQQQAFKLFTVNKHLEVWLTVKANVEPHLGGKYELFWTPAHPKYDSTIGCRITAIKPGKLLAFEWKGPKQYNHFMNQADPLTHVTVFFIPVATPRSSKPVTEVHLIHSGWRSSKRWEEARLWFERMWNYCFKELRKYVKTRNYSARKKSPEP